MCIARVIFGYPTPTVNYLLLHKGQLEEELGKRYSRVGSERAVPCTRTKQNKTEKKAGSKNNLAALKSVLVV